jgi:hypothetical protein
LAREGRVKSKRRRRYLSIEFVTGRDLQHYL